MTIGNRRLALALLDHCLDISMHVHGRAYEEIV